MLTVPEAQKIVLERCEPLAARTMPLNAGLLGLVLAEDVVSDLDLPPFDKALMDGYAVRADSLASGAAELSVIEEVTAGKTPTKNVGLGQATRIMTGAPMPDGADAVVMIEKSKLDGTTVKLEDTPKTGQHILRRGREMKTGEVILRRGQRLRPQELGILAAVGHVSVRVQPAARVGVLPTGDEVVLADKKPGPGQIRNSNGEMLMGQTTRAGGTAEFLGIAPDDVEPLGKLVELGLQGDVVILSGGVSAGKLDLVPGVLEKHGVEAHFHNVEMKPGRPMLFGTKKQGGRTTYVFGLPGNPVSSLVCFELFVRPALRKLRGLEPGPSWVSAEMREDYRYNSNRPTYHPAQLSIDKGRWVFRAVPWFGSPDLRGVLEANSFVLLPAGDHVHRAGQVFDVMMTESPLD